MEVILHRLCCQLLEKHGDFTKTAMVGLQPRGVTFANRLVHMLESHYGVKTMRFGHLDTTFFRDDFRRRDAPLQPNQTRIDFIVEDLKVVFVDDVLYTGRSTRAAMDAILSFGRPAEAELLVLIDRRFSRHLPIQADYVGRRVDSIDAERVVVQWKELQGEDKVTLTRAQK